MIAEHSLIDFRSDNVAIGRLATGYNVGGWVDWIRSVGRLVGWLVGRSVGRSVGKREESERKREKNRDREERTGVGSGPG